MLNEKIAELLNTQVNKEFYSAYLYLAFSNYFSEEGLDGFANWYLIQAQEERDHATVSYTHLFISEFIAPRAAKHGGVYRLNIR